jgi:thymidylate synthase
MFSYSEIVSLIAVNGLKSAPRGLPTYELIGSSIVLPKEIIRIKRKKSSLKLAWLESLMIFGGVFKLDWIAKVAPNCRLDLYEKQSDYGPRIWNQMLRASDILLNDPESRRAIIFLNSKEENTEDLTCATSIQFLLRNGKLNTVISSRSWDAVYGFVTDIFTFAFLHQAFALSIGAGIGDLHVNCGSFHIYDSTKDLAIENDLPDLITLNDCMFNEGLKSASIQSYWIAKEYVNTGKLYLGHIKEKATTDKLFGFNYWEN